MGWFAVTALAIGAVVASWFSVIKPELDDAASRAVDERLDDRFGAAAGDEDDDDDATPTPVDGAELPDLGASPATASGDPFGFRLPVSVSVGSQRSEPFDLPPDRRFELTDLVLQNPNGDLGRAELRRGAEVLYVWDLGAMTAPNEFQPRVTPLPFEPGESIVLAVTCEVVGAPTATGCEVSVLVGGMLYATDS